MLCMQIGIDLVKIAEIEAKSKDNPQFVSHLLTPEETKVWQMPTLAGKIAAKEAILKTGYIHPGQWHHIQIFNDDFGQPQAYDQNGVLIETLHISISHTDELCVATALYDNK